MHGVQGAVPTLPSSFGISPSQQPGLEEQSGNFGQDIVHDTSPIVFSASPPSAEAEANLSTRASLTFPAGSYPTRQIFSASAVAEYTPAPTILGAKKRGSGLLEPFAKMATVVEPKFSPDKRKLCSVEGCKSQARAFNRCKRHGGSKRCSSPGCTKSVQSRGLCIRHGGGSRCQESGCTRASQSHGRCKMHGGGRPCIVAGCEKKAHLKRLCRKHGGGAKCCISGCDKWAQRQGMCMTHSKVVDPNIGGDMMLPDRSLSPALSAPDASPSLQFFSDHVPV
ncbi:unnamed protein product [Phytophthora lilii]|uniref:Unnamed protein product n=1 Tax=Phytophthora lilii TaxID=2077276 RepID=A0A9W6TPI6_9STRA|nr:unnamed protein product [Phytophthora lilii]